MFLAFPNNDGKPRDKKKNSAGDCRIDDDCGHRRDYGNEYDDDDHHHNDAADTYDDDDADYSVMMMTTTTW